jgi:hypothetical protein
MRKLVCVAAAMAVSALVATPAFAQVGKGLSGKHWNLNFIGVPKDKAVPDMTGSHRHTVFVPLYNDSVSRKIKIFYVRGDDFRVLDGNATDDGEATIQVPYEFCEDYETGCTDLLSFDVYAVGLGKPNGYNIVTAECTYSYDVVDEAGTTDLECEDTLLLGSFSVTREKGKPKRENISDIFRATGCLDYDDSGVCDSGDLEFRNVWIFNIEELLEYWWDYENHGLKLMQVRFYETSSGYIGLKP